MSNQIQIQLTADGPKNSCFKVDLSLDSGDLDYEVIWDPLALYRDVWAPTNSCAIDEIQYAVSNPLSIGLFWDAQTPVPIVHLEGRGKFPLDWAGGIPNNAGVGFGIGGVSGFPSNQQSNILVGSSPSNPGAPILSGVTGRILLSTSGWLPGSILNASIFMQVHKTVI